MSDLVAALKAVDHGSVEDCFLQSPLFEKAADRIGALEAALKPFADAEKHIGDRMPDKWGNVMLGAIGLNLGCVRRARAALAGKGCRHDHDYGGEER